MAHATASAGKDRLGLLVPGDDRTPALRIAPRRGRVAGLHLLEALAGIGPAIPTPAAWQEALGHWGDRGRGHRLWILSNGAGLQGLAQPIKAIAARHRVVWIRPEAPHFRHLPNWPDPGFPVTVERLTWNLLDDPVTRLGLWLKGSGA